VSIITLASKDNGVGLTSDMVLLEKFFLREGHKVRRVDWEDKAIDPCDLIIFLELFGPQLLPYAKKSVFIPNLEWMIPTWIPELRGVTQMWAKSVAAYKVLKGLRFPTEYTGFLTRDRYDRTVNRELKCLHLKGRSSAKNTDSVIEAWQQYGVYLPPLTIITNDPLKRPVPPNVKVLGRLSDEEITYHLNSHRIHVCPSKVEGWGHYISEALTCRGVVITTSESPMIEHVRPDWGFIVPPYGVQLLPGTLVNEVGISSEKLAACVMEAAALPEDRLNEMGRAARAHALRRNGEFSSTARELLQGLLDPTATKATDDTHASADLRLPR
jgi:hypothetical protein